MHTERERSPVGDALHATTGGSVVGVGRPGPVSWPEEGNRAHRGSQGTNTVALGAGVPSSDEACGEEGNRDLGRHFDSLDEHWCVLTQECKKNSVVLEMAEQIQPSSLETTRSGSQTGGTKKGREDMGV